MIRRSMLAMTALLSAGIFFSGPALGQQKKEQLVGTWVLVSVTGEAKDGTKIDTWGPNPKGSLIFDGTGRFSLQLMRTDRPKFASNNRHDTTPEENRATTHGTLSYFGRYSMNEESGVLTFHVEASSYPNFTGIDQKRLFTLSGSELKYTNPAPTTAATTGATATHLVWKRS